MRTALRLLMCLAIFGSLGLAAVPTRVAAEQVKAGCCAKMKKEAEAKDCGQHSHKSNEDKQCCSLCVFCLATLASMGTPFVYPSTGEESFPLFTARELVRSHRPPVPPPRAAWCGNSSAHPAIGGMRVRETQQEDSMKYLLMLLAATALISTASATSESADDCCGGGACCPIKISCCAS